MPAGSLLGDAWRFQFARIVHGRLALPLSSTSFANSSRRACGQRACEKSQAIGTTFVLTTATEKEKSSRVKTLIPWLCVVALVTGAVYLHSANRKKDTELAALRAVSVEAEQLRTENAELKKAQVSQEEIERLRKDNEDLLRLRNEVRQLRNQQQQLTRQLQSAQTGAQQQQQQIQRLLAENQQARAAVQAAQAPPPASAPALSPEQQAAAAQAVANACINNLRQIDGAKQQWALENSKTVDAVPTAEQLAAYLKEKVLPTCPAGGKYTIKRVAEAPTCSIPGHVLPQ